jgi:hypothetical protein
MKITLLVVALSLFFILKLDAREYHVSPKGSDTNSGTVENPFRTISKAAEIAQSGDVIVVHEGTYRERVNPPRGGVSDENRITYRAATGARVEIKGSEIIRNWDRFYGNVWKAVIPNSFFGDYNPYKDLIYGDWFHDLGRVHHTGEVYLNGKSLYQMDILEKVLNPKPHKESMDQEGSIYTWYCESDGENIYLYANFHSYDPNIELVEINVRPTCFYPSNNGINFITVKGFHMSQAATQWAPPTAEQVGLIGTNWSKGWIIEDNVISNSKCTGITLGKDRQSGHNVWSADHNVGRDGNEHYIRVIKKVIENGWDRETIGSHIVRNNVIFNCEQAGICGSLGAIFSEVTGNHIYNIWTKRLFNGHEIAGIKFHAPIDVHIEGNLIHDTKMAIWMDWMTQGTRITRNLCFRNALCDLYSEVNHGPYLVDNNIFLSNTGIRDWSTGGAYVHNMIAGKLTTRSEWRATPYFLPHSTIWVDAKDIPGGDNRFYNNIFFGDGLDVYDKVKLPMNVNHNVYWNGAKRYSGEETHLENIAFSPGLRIKEENDGVYILFAFHKDIYSLKNPVVDTKMLGRVVIANQMFENTDTSPLIIDRDYFNNKRSRKNPVAGPFEIHRKGEVMLKVWEKFKPMNLEMEGI